MFTKKNTQIEEKDYSTIFARVKSFTLPGSLETEDGCFRRSLTVSREDGYFKLVLRDEDTDRDIAEYVFGDMRTRIRQPWVLFQIDNKGNLSGIASAENPKELLDKIQRYFAKRGGFSRITEEALLALF